MSLRILKWAQITLAALVTGFFVLLLPGAGAILLPVGVLYLVSAVRALTDHRFSAWLALLLTLFIAIVTGHDALQRIAAWLNGSTASGTEFSLFVTIAGLAVTVVALHGINWRWVVSPAARTQ